MMVFACSILILETMMQLTVLQKETWLQNMPMLHIKPIWKWAFITHLSTGDTQDFSSPKCIVPMPKKWSNKLTLKFVNYLQITVKLMFFGTMEVKIAGSVLEVYCGIRAKGGELVVMKNHIPENLAGKRLNLIKWFANFNQK